MSKYQYFKDFGLNIRYRWDGSSMELFSQGQWCPSLNFLDLDSLNEGMKGTRFEAVPTDENGVRL